MSLWALCPLPDLGTCPTWVRNKCWVVLCAVPLPPHSFRWDATSDWTRWWPSTTIYFISCDTWSSLHLNGVDIIFVLNPPSEFLLGFPSGAPETKWDNIWCLILEKTAGWSLDWRKVGWWTLRSSPFWKKPEWGFCCELQGSKEPRFCTFISLYMNV